MSQKNPTLWHDKSFKLYVQGFVFSLLFTFAAYLFATNNEQGGLLFGITLALFAFGQLVTQLVCFLHLDQESKPRYNQMAFVYTALTVFAIVAGSLWIMHNLHYNMAPKDPLIEQKIIEDEGYQPKR